MGGVSQRQREPRNVGCNNMKWLLLSVVCCTGCAPVYYGSIVYDIETTVACEACPEGNPLVPNTKSRPILYGYEAVFAAIYTWLVEKTEHQKLLYTVAAAIHFAAGTLNLRYVKY